MTEKPVIAATSPAEVELTEGKVYSFCTCGQSKRQPFCDGSHSGTAFTPHTFRAEKTETAWLCRCKHTKNTPFCDGTHSSLEG